MREKGDYEEEPRISKKICVKPWKKINEPNLSEEEKKKRSQELQQNKGKN